MLNGKIKIDKSTLNTDENFCKQIDDEHFVYT